MSRADSDSVNLGSNPSPPATDSLENQAFIVVDKDATSDDTRIARHTKPGTVNK